MLIFRCFVVTLIYLVPWGVSLLYLPSDKIWEFQAISFLKYEQFFIKSKNKSYIFSSNQYSIFPYFERNNKVSIVHILYVILMKDQILAKFMKKYMQVDL